MQATSLVCTDTETIGKNTVYEGRKDLIRLDGAEALWKLDRMKKKCNLYGNSEDPHHFISLDKKWP
jgi:hypothetical protein